MKVCLFSVFDKKTYVFLAPFVARSQVDACRQIKGSFKDPAMFETPVGQHPEDFDLMCVGNFDDESGDISPVKPMLIARLVDLCGDLRSGTVST